MDKDQLSAWVWTFSHSKKWAEGEYYASKFNEAWMTGDTLGMVNMEILKSLGIEIKDHRDELLSEIKRLISNEPLAQRPIEIEQREPSFMGVHSSLPSWDNVSSCLVPMFIPYSQTYCGSSISSCLTQSSQGGLGFQRVINNPYYNLTSGTVFAQSGFASKRPPRSSHSQLVHTRGRNDAVFLRKDRPNEYHKLVLELQGDEISQYGDIYRIFSLFQSVDPLVDVQKMEEDNTYTLIFQDNRRAKKALIEYREKGFKIAVKFRRKPSPNRPMDYITLEPLQILKGKSLKGDHVGWLHEGQRVTVNQVKGKRARLIKPNQEVKDWGWVSMYSHDDGRRLLRTVSY